ncbi:MAG: hypothetical protein R3Y44_02375 [Rikenellaceae bacterium]
MTTSNMEHPELLFSTKSGISSVNTIDQAERLGQYWGLYKRHFQDFYNEEVYYEALAMCRTEQDFHDCRVKYCLPDTLDEYYALLGMLLEESGASRRVVMKCYIKSLLHEYDRIEWHNIGFELSLNNFGFPTENFNELYDALMLQGEEMAAKRLRTLHLRKAKSLRMKIMCVRNDTPQRNRVNVMVHEYLSKLDLAVGTFSGELCFE